MAEIQHIRLSELTKKIEEHIKNSFGTQLHWIVAEISGHKFYPDPGRHYFDWVEKIEGQNVETAKVKGIAWSAGSQSIKKFEEETSQKFTNGIQVLAQVRVEFHAIHGFSIILVDIDPSFTLGNLERQRRDTLLKLVELNPNFITKVGEEFITRNKQLKLRAVLQKIALVASPNSEGYNDFIHTMKSNQFGYRFHIDEYQSSVQGALAETELVNTLIKIYNSKIDYDCVVIVRGGGAKTDFLVFDTYKVAQAVAKFPIPIITGIGHHKDISIADLMTHTNTKTPTKSAELIIDHARAFEEEVLKAQKNIIIRTQHLINTNRQEINANNLLIIHQSRILLTQHKDSLSEINQLVLTKSQNILHDNKASLLEVQQEILNNSRSKLTKSTTRLSGMNQSLVTKTNKILFAASTDLTRAGQEIKNNSLRYFNKSTNSISGLSQRISNSSVLTTHIHQVNLTKVINQIISKPFLITTNKSSDLKHTTANLSSLTQRFLNAKNSNIEHKKIFMKAMSPDNILKKGFALVSQNGKVIKDSKTIEVGSKLTITMNDTEIITSVISKNKKDERK